MNFKQTIFTLSLLTVSGLALAQRQAPGVNDLRVEPVDFTNLQRTIDEMDIHVNDPDRDTRVNQLYVRVPDFKVAYEKYKARILSGYESFSRNAPIVVETHNERLQALFLKKRSEIAALEELRNDVSDLPEQVKILNKNIKKHLSEFHSAKVAFDQQFQGEYLSLFQTSNTKSTQALSQFYREGGAFGKILVAAGATVAGVIQTVAMTLAPLPLPGIGWVWFSDNGDFMYATDVMCPFVDGQGDASYALTAIQNASSVLPKNVKASLKAAGPTLFEGCKTSICVNYLASYMIKDTKEIQRIEKQIINTSPITIKRKDKIMKNKMVSRLQKMIKWASDEYSQTLPTAIFTEVTHQ